MARVDGWLFVACCGLTGGLTTVSASVVLVVYAGVASLLSPFTSRLALGAGILAFGVVAFSAHYEIREYRVAHERARLLLGAPQRCLVAGKVENSPMVRAGSARVTLIVDLLDCEQDVTQLVGDESALRARIYNVPSDLVRGERIEAIAQLGVVRLFRNEGQLNPYVFWARSFVTLSGSALVVERLEPGAGLFAAIDRARAHVRVRIEEVFSEHAKGMAKALVLGENDLTRAEHEAFNRSGLSHLLAVSGTHLVFAVVALVRALRALLARCGSLPARYDVGRLASLVGVGLALVYADFAGGSGSAWRAAWMLAAAFGVRAFGARVTAARAVAVSIAIGVIDTSLVVFDLSFLLSLAATAGLLTIGKTWQKWIRKIRSRSLRLVAESFSATVASMIPCTLVLALISTQISVLGVFANVVAGPFGETVALPLCLVFGLLGFVPVLEQGVATVASGALLVVRELALWTSDNVEWSIPVVLPNELHFAAATLGVATFWSTHQLLRGIRRRFAKGALTVLCLAAIVAGEFCTRRSGSPNELRVTHLDVGQGDAALVDLPQGALMIVDGGGFVGSPVDPGERVLLPVLRSRRRAQIDVMVLSHPHPDHYGGLLAVARALPVKELWDTGQGRSHGPHSKYAQLLQAVRLRGGIVRRPEELCGQQERSGVLIDVLGPCPGVNPDVGANDNSLVLRLTWGGRSVLFTGDAEGHQEAELVVRNRDLLRANHLKIGHHGSKTSTSHEFLAAVGPETAIISSGIRNRFGHPHANTLETLNEAGVEVLRVDQQGSVTWSAGSGLSSTWLLRARRAGIFDW